MENNSLTIKRPKGVTVLCILNVVSIGFFPLFTLYIIYSRSPINVVGLFDTVVTVLTSAAIFVLAYFALNGSKKGKVLMLYLVYFHIFSLCFISLIMLFNPQLFGMEQLDAAHKGKEFSRIVSNMILLLINYNYFKGKKAVDYYNQNSTES